MNFTTQKDFCYAIMWITKSCIWWICTDQEEKSCTRVSMSDFCHTHCDKSNLLISIRRSWPNLTSSLLTLITLQRPWKVQLYCQHNSHAIQVSLSGSSALIKSCQTWVRAFTITVLTVTADCLSTPCVALNKYYC